MNVNPGELNKKIQIIAFFDEGTNKNGFTIKGTEKIIRTCFAKVSNTSGSEIVKANSEFADAKKRFLVRYSRKEINTGMIVRYKGEDFDIKYVNPYNDGKEYIEIWAENAKRVKQWQT